MSAAGSIMGDRPHLEGDPGRAATVTLPGDYTGRLTAIAAIPNDSMFVTQAPVLPRSYMTTWGTEFANDTHPSLSGPVESILVGCNLGQIKGNPGAPFAGVADDKMALASIAEVFLKDVGVAVAAAAEKYNQAMAAYAENAGIPNYVRLKKAESYRDSANFKTRQDAIAALNVRLNPGVTVQDAYADQTHGPAQFALVAAGSQSSATRSGRTTSSATVNAPE